MRGALPVAVAVVAVLFGAATPVAALTASYAVGSCATDGSTNTGTAAYQHLTASTDRHLWTRVVTGPGYQRHVRVRYYDSANRFLFTAFDRTMAANATYWYHTDRSIPRGSHWAMWVEEDMPGPWNPRCAVVRTLR